MLLRNNESIIIFIKNPDSSPVKTRLAKHTNINFAKKFYKNSILDTINSVKKTKIPYFIFSYPDLYTENSIIQKGKDLGERMYNAFKWAFANEFKKVLIMGSDIPHITSDILIDAFKKLNEFDYVIGPCFDGGYYLIGMKKEKLKKQIFENIDWSTDKVFSQTIEKLQNYYVLKKMYDIDTIEDLKKFYYENKNNSSLNTVKFLKIQVSHFL